MVQDKDVEEEEEDMDVAQILNDAKAKHQKNYDWYVYNVKCNACYSCWRGQRYTVQM